MRSMMMRSDDIKLVKTVLVVLSPLLFIIACFIPAARAESPIYADDSLHSAELPSILLSDEYYVYETELSFVMSDHTDQWGFYDKKSGFLQLPMYDHVYDLFANDPSSPILVEHHGQIAYLNRTNGEVVIPFRYQYYWYCSEFRDGYAVVTKNQKPDQSVQTVLIDELGNEILFPFGLMPTSFVYNGTVVIVEEGWDDFQYGLGRVDGTVLLAPRYDYIADFHEGFACIEKIYKFGDRWEYRYGHIDYLGNEIVPPIYNLRDEDGGEGYYFENGVAELVLADGTGSTTIYIDYFGNIVGAP